MPKGQNLHLVSHQRRVIIPIPRTHFVSSEVGTRFCVFHETTFVVFSFPLAQPALLSSDMFYFQWLWTTSHETGLASF